jgi:hypothetical protein
METIGEKVIERGMYGAIIYNVEEIAQKEGARSTPL